MMLYFKELEKNGNKVSIKPNHKDTENYSTQLFFSISNWEKAIFKLPKKFQYLLFFIGKVLYGSLQSKSQRETCGL